MHCLSLFLNSAHLPSPSFSLLFSIRFSQFSLIFPRYLPHHSSFQLSNEMAIRFSGNSTLFHPYPSLNHHIYGNVVLYYLDVRLHFLTHSFFFCFSYFPSSHQSVNMSSTPLSTDTDARILVPSPLWWQPCTRWVAITHLPTRLHTHSTLASMVAYFGTLVSFSYPADCEDKGIVLALVANCFITKIPHIMPVKDGERVFPVRVQIIFQTKIGDKGIIFDPLDLGDAFCNFYSHGQCPSGYQQGATFSVIPTTRTHAQVRDRRKLTPAGSTSSMPPPPPIRTISSVLSESLVKDTIGVSHVSDSKSQNLAYMEQALTSAIHKFNLEATGKSHDSDNTGFDMSHQSRLYGLTAKTGKLSDETTVVKMSEDKGKAKKMQDNDTDNTSVRSTLKDDWAPPPMHFPFQPKIVSSDSSVMTRSLDKNLHCSTAQSQLNWFKPGTLLKSPKDSGTVVGDKKDTAWGRVPSQKWASPPIIFKRRRMSKWESQGKDGVMTKSQKTQNGNVSFQNVDRMFEGEVSNNLGMSNLK